MLTSLRFASSSYGYNIVVAVSAYSCKDEIMEN